MYKFIMISGSSCAGCTSLQMEVNTVLPQFSEVTYQEYSLDQMNQEVQALIDNYHIEKIPTLLLLKDDVEIGKVSGYQPAEILSYWLKDKLEL